MPDTPQLPGFAPLPSSQVFVPDTGMPKAEDLSFDHQLTMQNLGPTGDEYAKSISYGESITDLIADVQNLQREGENLLNNYGSFSGSGGGSSTIPGFNPNDAYNKLAKQVNPEERSLLATNKPMVLGTQADYDRYKNSKNFQTFGLNPMIGEEQEYLYGRAQTWGETIANGLAGAGHLAADTFIEGWKGWGRMAEALFTWDSSKLMGSPEERYEMAKKQEDIMNKYAIYDTAESKETLWNRQFFGNMLQQSGFAVGAALQFAAEEALTFGASSFFAPLTKGFLLGRVARSAEELAKIKSMSTLARGTDNVAGMFKPKGVFTVGELVNDTRKVANTITKSPRVENSILTGMKRFVPVVGSVEEMAKMYKAGAGFAQLAFTGLGGIRRGLSEFNMARSESIFEAAGTYKTLTDRLVNDFINKNGREPNATELEKIKQTAERASHDNFWTNVGVLSVMNRIQFNTMFNTFKKSRNILSEGMNSLAGKAFQVSGKIEGKAATRAYKTGLLGRVGAARQIAKDFGKKTAAWEVTKSIGKGLMKFEGSEGMQELIQEASNKGLTDYYYDLYHGKKGYGSKMDSILGSMQNPLTDMQGMKTFLMGALTGRLIAPMTLSFSKISEANRNYQGRKAAAQTYKQLLNAKVQQYKAETGKEPQGDDLKNLQDSVKQSTEFKTTKDLVNESVAILNNFFQDPTWFKKEALANIKVNNKAAETMDEAAANQDKYVFNNSKDSALAKTVAAAIKLDMYESLRDSIKEFGVEFTDKEFKEAFGIDPTETNKKNVKNLTDTIVNNVEDYYNTYKILKDKYADKIIPELYKNNAPEDYIKAKQQKEVLDSIIEMLATNSYKAKQVIVRASELQTEISKNPNIGASAAQVLTVLGSEKALERHLNLLKQEIRNIEQSEIKTPEQRELYKSKKEELKNIIDWKDSREALDNDRLLPSDPRSNIGEQINQKSYKAFANLINIMNERNRIDRNVSRDDVQDVYSMIIDYIKLNRDHKEYIDAMNLLTDPKNMELVKNASMSAMDAMMKKFMAEMKADISEGTGVDVYDIPKHTVEQNPDDNTWYIVDPAGVVVAKGFATKEEAEEEAKKKDAEYEAALNEEENTSEEPQSAESLETETGVVDISDPLDIAVGDVLLSQDSGLSYTITKIEDDKITFKTNLNGVGSWTKEEFEKLVKDNKVKKQITRPKKTGTKGYIKVDGKVITMEDVPGKIDFTGNEKNPDFDTMMTDVTVVVKNWDKEFIKNNLVHYNGQFIFNYDGRVFVLARVGKFIVPYYFSSSGTSGKAIDWHYVFGINNQPGWIIKGAVDKQGEVYYGDIFKGRYPKAIAELEKIKKELRTKLAMTESQRNSLAKLVFDNRAKYPKSVDSIYQGLDVVEDIGPDGVETNDNYDYLINATLGLIGLDNNNQQGPQQNNKQSKLNEAIEKIKNASTKEELRKILNDVSDEDIVNPLLEEAVNEALDRIDKQAAEAGANKTLKDTDPEFVKEYEQVLSTIDQIVNKPDVTLNEISEAFRLLYPVLAKLEDNQRKEYYKKYGEIKKEVLENAAKEIASKDIEGSKKLITDSFASDTNSLNTTFDLLYNELNIKLKPEFKQELVEHFEKEYLKAIDRRISNLQKNANTSETSEVLSELLELKDKFQNSVQTFAKRLEEKSKKLREKKGDKSYIVKINPGFDNPTHRGIMSNTNPGVRSSAQKIAIANLLSTDIITSTDVDSYNESTRKGASEIINLGVARILTLQIHKGLNDHFGTKNNSDKLKQALYDYLIDLETGFDAEYNPVSKKLEYPSSEKQKELKQDIADAIDGFLDKNEFKTSEELLKALNIPINGTDDVITDEEFALFSEYRKAMTAMMSNNTVLDILDSWEQHSEKLFYSKNKVTDADIIDKKQVGLLNRFLNKYEDSENFYADVLASFPSILKGTKSEALKTISNLSQNYFKRGSDGLALLQSLYAGAISDYNFARAFDASAEPLTETEILNILENPNTSLNKQQILQVENFAKTEQLQKYKTQLNAAVGFKSKDKIFTYEPIDENQVGLPFNSLRQKFSTDMRTIDQLTKLLEVDADGTIKTDKALRFVIESEFATEYEKELAKKLLRVVSEEDVIKVNNNLESAGMFDHVTKEISINLDIASYKEDLPSVPLETVILHELVHAVIEDSISDPSSEYTQAIKSLYNTVKNIPGAETFYAYQKNLDEGQKLREFVTEAMTNPSFQYLLAKTPYANTNKTVWEAFVEILSQILSSLGINIDDTALSEVLSLTNDLINKNAITIDEELPSEKYMQKIATAATTNELKEIRKELDANKDKDALPKSIYNSIIASIKQKAARLSREQMDDAIKNLKEVKVGKLKYYYSDKAGGLEIFKRGRVKLSKVTNQKEFDAVKSEIEKNVPPPPPPPPGPETSTGKGKFSITSDLANKTYVEDPSAIDISTVGFGVTITAVEKTGLRSKGNDGQLKNGEYVEDKSFKLYYYKVRNIINKLALAPLDSIANFYVTLDKDAEGLRWDGSKDNPDWATAEKGVIGYISDKEGNPIVFNKDGKAIGRADKNNPSASQFNNGENQIVYFNTYTRKTDERSLSRINPEELDIIFKARDKVMNGKPQIAKLKKVSKGQMVLKGLVKPKSSSQKNTLRDKDIVEKLSQDHVSFVLQGQYLNAVIEDNDGALQGTPLFTPVSKSVKITSSDGNVYSLFDYLIELMKVYHEMKRNNDPLIGDVGNDLWNWAKETWITGRDYNLQIHQKFKNITIKLDVKRQLPIFEEKNGIMTINEDNLAQIRSSVNRMRVNVSKQFLEGKLDFKFPYITEVDGKKVINFEKMNYMDYLMNNVGLTTYINDIPAKDAIKRYNSTIHFLEPSDLNPTTNTISVTSKDLNKDDNAIDKAVDKAAKDVNTSKKEIKLPGKKKSFAPRFELNHKKSCK